MLQTIRRRLVVGAILILILVNLVYFLLLLNPKYTMDRMDLNAAHQKVLFESQQEIDQILVFGSTVYGIFANTDNSVIFGYTDHFLFQVPIPASFYSIHLKLASSIGIFVEIDNILYLYNNTGVQISKFDTQYLLKGLDQGIYSADYFQNWIFEVGDGIYKVTGLLHQVYSDSQPLENTTIIEIKAWNLKNSDHDFSTTMGNPDVVQKIQFNSANYQPIFDVNINKGFLSQKMNILVANSSLTNSEVDLLTYKISFDSITLDATEKVVSLSEYSPILPEYKLLGTSVVIQTVSPDNKWISFKELHSDAEINTTISRKPVFYVGLKLDRSSIIIYGGTYNAYDRTQPIFLFIQLQNNEFYTNDQTTSSSLPIYFANIVRSGKTLYITTVVTNADRTQLYQLVRYTNAVAPSPFLDNLDPGLQLNLLAIPIIIIYITIIYVNKDRKTSLIGGEKLGYPEREDKT